MKPKASEEIDQLSTNKWFPSYDQKLKAAAALSARGRCPPNGIYFALAFSAVFLMGSIVGHESPRWLALLVMPMLFGFFAFWLGARNDSEYEEKINLEAELLFGPDNDQTN